MKNFSSLILIIGTIFGLCVSALGSPSFSWRQKRLIGAGEWLAQESQIATGRIRANISPLGAAPGVVLASPQTANPNYYRHWVRDAAISMEAIVELSSRAGARRSEYEQMLHHYVVFSRQNQLEDALSGLGEPIFEVNGQPFRGPWGRPQNDGPALRAITLTEWAFTMLKRGQEDYVRTWLYSANLPAITVIKADLEYVAHHWQESSFDLWEEVRGDHFFTRMVQRRALLLGALLAERLGDGGAAEYYRNQAVFLGREINNHYVVRRNLIIPTLNRVEGVDYKGSHLDIAVLLGVLHGEADGFFSVQDSRVVGTIERLIQVFAQLYPINQVEGTPGIALGRYPEDKYSGSDFGGGNPWVIATLAGAEYMYKLAAVVGSRGNSPANQVTFRKLIEQGDAFVQRVQLHANPDGSLSEQINRGNGYMMSARDLTWNYAALLKVAWARERVVRNYR